MAESVVSFVVEQLGLLIVQEAKFLSGVGDQIQRAHTDLQFMKGFLKDADAKQRDNETIRIFVAKTRDAAYDLEDVIETFILKMTPRKAGGIKNVLKKLDAIHRHKIGSEIGVITTTISNLKRNLQSYDILRELKDSGGASSNQSQDQRQQQLRRTYSHVIERNVVGLEDSVHQLVEHLVKEEHRHRVVSIWGMGGSGKSTLAKEVYHHQDVKQHFDCFAWVCISQQYQVRDVLERIYVKLISATNEEREEIARLKDDEIHGKLSSVQKERKCLVVLDDIWKIETWDFLKAAFECGEDSKSRILLTTRNEKVALHADVNGFHFQPPPLNETQSWELLEKIAMLGRRNAGVAAAAYKMMEELGKEMVRHCAGLPLAVSVLAGLLARKTTVEEWVAIKESVGVYISRGFGGNEEEHAYASRVLAFSYDDLPYHLKPCFLYLGLFPEDHVIRVKTLARLWIAEGFISLTDQRQVTGETMEDVAYSWLNELVERCMIQIGKRSLTLGKIKTCRMHDLLRDLCLSKAKEENFVQVCKCSHKNEAMLFSSFMGNSASPTGKIRRLAIYLDENDEILVPSRDQRGGHVRSLLYFGPNDFYWFPKRKELIPSMFKDFDLLRALRIEGMFDDEVPIELPSEIGNMVHLRFLSLRRTHVQSFPPFLGNLVCLQTLDLRVYKSDYSFKKVLFFRWKSTDDEIIIPNVIWKMNQLRHLYLPEDYRVRGKLKLSTLGHLQTLYNALSQYCDLKNLNKLRSLRKLRIRASWSPLEDPTKLFEAAGSVLNGIRSLSLDNNFRWAPDEELTQILARCGQIYKLNLRGFTPELPKEFHSYSNLTKLILSECGLKDDQMAVLEKLPNLIRLTFKGYVFEEKTKVLVFSDGSFPRLQYLVLRDMKEITECRVEEGAMPSLFKLVIDYCIELTSVPDGLRHLTTLKELKISSMGELFCSKLEEGGEDFHKVQHIPSLIIR